MTEPTVRTEADPPDPRWPRYAAALLGFVWFLQIGGGPTLNPTHSQLLFSGDWMQHWFGWLMFRREPWTFPLGQISGLPYPVGTTLGFTDANPLVSLILKPISGWLPEEFQFIGLWLAFCFVMQGYTGAALASTVTRDPRGQLFGGYLFVLSPVLVGRIAHDTLAAHWLLLAVMYFGLREYRDAAAARRGARLAVGTSILAATIHPYLTAMCWLLALAALIRLWRARLLSPLRAGVGALSVTGGVVLVFAALGFFSTARSGASGFGQYSADILALVNPDQFSRMLFDLRIQNARWEGLAFLGLGGLAAAILTVAVVTRHRPSLRRGVIAVILAAVAMAVFAFSSPLNFAGREVADLHWFYRFVPFLTQGFRASGRFIWCLHYLVLLGGIWGVMHLWRSRPAAGVTLIAVLTAVQAADMRMDSLWAQKEFREVPFQDFAPAVGQYRHLALVPMQVRGVCRPYNEAYVYRYMLHAYRLKTSFNSGYFSRFDGAALQAACERFEQDVTAGRLDPETIYIPGDSYIPIFQAAGAACGRFNGEWACVSRESDHVFRTYIETGRLIERNR